MGTEANGYQKALHRILKEKQRIRAGRTLTKSENHCCSRSGVLSSSDSVFSKEMIITRFSVTSLLTNCEETNVCKLILIAGYSSGCSIRISGFQLPG